MIAIFFVSNLNHIYYFNGYYLSLSINITMGISCSNEIPRLHKKACKLDVYRLFFNCFYNSFNYNGGIKYSKRQIRLPYKEDRIYQTNSN